MDEETRTRMAALEARLAARRRAEVPKPRSQSHHSMAEVAWRMVIELVVGIGLGFGIGYGLDGLLGTQPVFMVVFVLFGFAAGVNVMMRTAKEINLGAGPDDGGAGRDDDDKRGDHG